MNEIVRKVVPVSELPEELRRGFDPAAEVEIKGPGPAAQVRSKKEIFAEVARLRASGEIKTVTAEEAVKRIRELRDEW